MKTSTTPQIKVTFVYDNSGAGFYFGETGLGVAILKTFEVTVDGKPQNNWIEMLHTLGIPASSLSLSFFVPYPEDIYQHESELKKLFWVQSSPASNTLRLNAGRIVIAACYCSVYDDCKLTNSKAETYRVKSCTELSLVFKAPPVQVGAQLFGSVEGETGTGQKR